MSLPLRNIALDATKEWESALPYFQARGGVIFLSGIRTWEVASQAHQNLAITLAKHGVPTVWFDDYGWSGKDIFVPPAATGPLMVRRLPVLPGRRFSAIDSLSASFQSQIIERQMKGMGKDPLIWVHSALLPKLVEKLPYIDVFSVFDDMDVGTNPLLKKSRLVVTQNEHAKKVLGASVDAIRLLPTWTTDHGAIWDLPPASLPVGFPQQRMGYIGSVFESYFDYDLFEKLIGTLGNWGFVLAGRADAGALRRIEQLKKYPNFVYLPFVPRHQVGSYWKLLDVCLLLYRPLKTQAGAFASKSLEALHFGASLGGVLDYKTEYFQKDFPLIKPGGDIVEAALKASRVPKEVRERTLRQLQYEMSPEHYLSVVTQQLSK